MGVELTPSHGIHRSLLRRRYVRHSRQQLSQVVHCRGRCQWPGVGGSEGADLCCMNVSSAAGQESGDEVESDDKIIRVWRDS